MAEPGRKPGLLLSSLLCLPLFQTVSLRGEGWPCLKQFPHPKLGQGWKMGPPELQKEWGPSPSHEEPTGMLVWRWLPATLFSWVPGLFFSGYLTEPSPRPHKECKIMPLFRWGSASVEGSDPVLWEALRVGRTGKIFRAHAGFFPSNPCLPCNYCWPLFPNMGLLVTYVFLINTSMNQDEILLICHFYKSYNALQA